VLLCDLLSIKLFDVVGNFEPSGVICEFLKLFFPLFVYLITYVAIFYAAVEKIEFLGIRLHYSLEIAANYFTFCLLWLLLCLFLLLCDIFRERVLFLNFCFSLLGVIGCSLKHGLKRLDLRESEHFFVEFCEYLFVDPLPRVPITSLHHPNRSVNYFHDKLSVVSILTQLDTLILIIFPFILDLYLQIFRDLDLVTVNEIVLFVIYSVDFVDNVVHP